MPFVTARRSALPLAALLALLVASPALADSHASPELGIAPLGYDGPWFDLELDPGDQVELEIELANHGEQSVEARSYVADVYSLINGGMGVNLHDETSDNAVTGWIDYPAFTPTIGADSALRRTVTVAVPEDTEPGQYIAALLIEHDADRSDAPEDLGIDQVVRQAVAVNVTVPGAVAPQLELGETGHLLTAERSTLRTDLENPGNWHLVPSGDLELTGPDGQTVTEQDLDLTIVYAGTSTHVETVLDEELDPGTYQVTTTLADANHDVETTHTSSFEVEAPPRNSPIPGVDRVIQTLDSAGIGLLGVSLIVLGLLLLGLLIALGRRRHVRERSTPPPPADIADQPPPPPPAAPRPEPAKIDTSFFTANAAPATRRRRR